MPGKRESHAAPGFCRRCEINEATIDVRSEPLCRTCFARYVHTKVVKRMDTFRAKYNPRAPQTTYLVPLSFGVSSTALLQALDQHLNGQMQKSGRASYALHVLHIDTSAVDNTSGEVISIDRVKERFPNHAYSSVAIENVSDLSNDKDTAGGPSEDPVHQDKVPLLLSKATSGTARADLLQTLRTRQIVAFAKKLDYSTILWGDSTTRLAEKTLSLTAKGQAFQLPWTTSDGDSPHSVRFQYPMRDLLKKELLVYAEGIDPPLTPLLTQQTTKAPVSTRNTTIDELVTQYFRSVEDNYPGIVANVVRTTGKLHMPDIAADDPRCGLCDLPIRDEGVSDENGGNEGVKRSEEYGALCTGCAGNMFKVF